MATPEWTLGDRLAKARKDVGCSQQEMGEHLGVSRATINGWERMRHQPMRNGGFLPMIYKWAEITNVDPSWLLGLGNGSVNVRSRLRWDDLDFYPDQRDQLPLLQVA